MPRLLLKPVGDVPSPLATERPLTNATVQPDTPQVGHTGQFTQSVSGPRPRVPAAHVHGIASLFLSNVGLPSPAPFCGPQHREYY